MTAQPYDRAAHLRRINDRSRAEAAERRAGLIEDVEWLRDLDPDQIAERLGRTVAALEIALRRAHRYDLARPFNNTDRRQRYYRKKATA